MNILFYGYAETANDWTALLARLLPHARISVWEPGDTSAADYLVVRNPPQAMLASRPGLKAVFNLGAGVDALLRLRAGHHCPALDEALVIRLEDAGMGVQMADYVSHAVLHFQRRFHEYERQQRAAIWRPLQVTPKPAFPVGVMGAGVLGAEVAAGLCRLGFPVRIWSRSAKEIAGCTSFAGPDQLPAFAQDLKALVNLLPLTAATRGILNAALFDRLADGAFLINVARGAHLVDDDLLDAIRRGKIDAARLDVFNAEPLPADHPFWHEPAIYLTPHVSAENDMEQSLGQIADRIRALENGQPVTGVVNWHDEY
ncbi:2-hydroxyacid dehydrogenase [Noviherbaspirillum sp.]|uniref:2-hydroxyacid dehydrogenase n=1 Tax=Noviherbaspirillum sp. TaxID=1926288 RepID=UPI002FDFA525